MLPKSERPHVVIIGRRNAGKSSLLNALCGQNAALVSEIPGTTTDPVYKTFELFGVGPVVLVDTGGLDDGGALGSLRAHKARATIRKADLALLTVDLFLGYGDEEREIENHLMECEVPFLRVATKTDLDGDALDVPAGLRVSSVTGAGIKELTRELASRLNRDDERWIVKDLIKPEALVALVVAFDRAAPSGRLKALQSQVLREIVDAGALGVVVGPEELPNLQKRFVKWPDLVICDSQVLKETLLILPEEVTLTTFSILVGRYKGDIDTFFSGVESVKNLREGDRVLIAEACSHQPLEEEIARTAIPRKLDHFVEGNLNYAWSQGGDFPSDLRGFSLIVHCGGCMITRQEMHARQAEAKKAGIPMVNFGVLLAHFAGSLDRTTACFKKG